MAITVAEFRTRFPEFADSAEYPTITITNIIQDAILIYIGGDEDRWNGKYNFAQHYLVAHLLNSAMLTSSGDVSAKEGVITSKSAGGVSVSYAAIARNLSVEDSFFMTTAYGQRFISVRNGCFAPVAVANIL